MNKILKVPLSCRANPQLKKALEEEATERGMTTSAYLISLLDNRDTISDNENEDRLNTRIVELEETVEDLEQSLSIYENDDYENISEETEKEDSDNLVIISDLRNELSLLENDYENLAGKLRVYEDEDQEDDFVSLESLQSEIELHETEVIRLQDIVNEYHAQEEDDDEYVYTEEEVDEFQEEIEVQEAEIERLQNLVDDFENTEETDDNDYTEELDELRQENSELSQENENLKSQLSEMEADNITDGNPYSQSSTEVDNDSTLFEEEYGIEQLNDAEKEVYSDCLTTLSGIHPEMTPKQLLLASLHTVCKNESSFLFTHTIKGAQKALQAKLS